MWEDAERLKLSQMKSPLKRSFFDNWCALFWNKKIKNVAKKIMQRLDNVEDFLQYSSIDEVLQRLETREPQWLCDTSDTMNCSQWRGAVITQDCWPWITLKALEQSSSHTHTHIQRCMLLTGHNELNLLRYGGPQFVWGVTAIGSLVLSEVPIIGYHKGPRVLFFHQPWV